MIGVVARAVAKGITRVQRLKPKRKKTKAGSGQTWKWVNC